MSFCTLGMSGEGGSLYDVTFCLTAWSHVPSEGLCPWSHVPLGVSVQWVSVVQGCLCPGGSLSMGGHYPGDRDTPSTVDKRAVRILLECCLVSLWIWIQKEPLMFPHWVQLFSAVLSSGFEWKDELSWTFEIFTRSLFK